MGEWWVLIKSDIGFSTQSWGVADFAVPIGLMLWCFIVFWPLTGIDRRDWTTGMTYVLYCLAAGVGLILAVPQNFNSSPKPMYQILIMVVMAAVAAVRFSDKSGKQAIIEKKAGISGQKGRRFED